MRRGCQIVSHAMSRLSPIENRLTGECRSALEEELRGDDKHLNDN